MNPSDLPDETLFERALECRTSAERAAFLDEACAGRPEVRARLEALLAAHEGGEGRLDPTLVEVGRVGGGGGTAQSLEGAVIGRYKLLQRIGEGGMGVVYMAEQTEPVVRKVAFKIIRLGMDTRQVVARFEAERQALALMDHPNIARVLDAGATDSGRPYFVMELVHGVPITEYCDRNKLDPKARLELFIPVCQAVQHAHQKGIIHRDLKPSNVMVTLHDGVPVPKVIDFGVAKATNQRLTEKTLFTHYAQMIGTPAYMSPEQAEMSGLDIDTRSDVYSLGVLLYELLTGTTPFDARALLSKGYAEMQRIIAEEEPAKPSTRMSTLAESERTVVAKNRGVEGGALRRSLEGDLDWIVMKCLEKDRTRRYETSSGLAADIRRHLDSELITARPPTTGYLLGKLIRRNKAAFVTSAAIAASLVVGLVVAAWALQREARSRQRAERNFRMARRIVDEPLKEAIKALSGFPKTSQIRRKLEEQVLEYYRDFADQNRNDPALQQAVAGAFQQVAMYHQSLGQFDKSLEFAERSAAEYEALAARHPTERSYREGLMHAIKLQGFASSTLGQYSNYVGRLSHAATVARSLAADYPDEPLYPVEVARIETDLGIALWTRSQLTQAVEHFQTGLKHLESRTARFPKAPGHSGTEAKIHHWLGACLRDMDRLDAAEQHIRQALSMRQSLAVQRPETDDEDLPHMKVYLASVIKWDRPHEAAQLLREAVARIGTFSERDPDSIPFSRILRNTLRSLADLLLDLGQVDEAEQLCRRGLTLDQAGKVPTRISLDGGSSLAASHYGLGKVLDRLGRTEAAAEQFTRAVAVLDELVRRNPGNLTSQMQLAGILLKCPQGALQDPSRAERLLGECVQMAPESRSAWALLGLAQLRNGQPKAAIPSLRRSVEITGIGAPDQWLYLAMALHQAGETAEARQWYEKAIAWMDRTRTVDSGYLRLRKEAAALLGR